MNDMEMISPPGVSEPLRNLGWEIQFRHEGVEVVTEDPDNVCAEWEWVENAEGMRCELSIANNGMKDVPVFEIRLKFLLTAGMLFDRVFVQSWAMNGGTGLVKAANGLRSSGVMGWGSSREAAAVVGGFLDHASANTRVEMEWGGGPLWQVTATVFREGVPLAPGATLEISPFCLRTGNSLSRLLEEYAEEVALNMGSRMKKPAESGWCSWYHFYGKETFEDVVSCAEELSESRLSSLLRTVQIDDGWNRCLADNPPDAWGDWEAHPAKFPSGMAGATSRIHGLGFRAGLWLAPFAIARKSRFFAEHPDWLIRHREPATGELVPAPVADNPDIFSLDCTHPGALAWLRATFSRVFFEWEFDYVKIDFLHFGVREGIRHDSEATSIEAYRRGLQVISDVAGEEKFILGCGAPLLASVGLVDGMRVGPDVGGRWSFDAGLTDWPVGNCSVRAAAIPSLWSQWMHGRWWQNDPDCLVVRETPPVYEQEFFQRVEKEMAAKNLGCRATPLGLTEEEAGLWTRLVWMSGGMALLSEVWSELPALRQNMLETCFKPHGRDVSILDWFGEPDVAALVAGGESCFAGFFNFGDRSCRPRIRAKEIGLSGRWVLQEVRSGTILEGEGNWVEFPELPPHAGRVWRSIL